MSTPLDAKEMLDREFLEIRARLLQVAASLDRVGRSEGAVTADARMEKILEALAILSDSEDRRAERIQLVFSRPYETDWKTTFKLQTARS
jgi:hypothetical protein